MKEYLLKNRQGQFLAIGTVFLVIGFILLAMNQPDNRFVFYLSIIFLGYYAAKDAVVETIQNKTPNVDLLMILAALGSTLIYFESEGASLLFIFAAAKVLENYANDKSTRAISELMAQVPETAQLLHANGDIIEVLTTDLKIGDIVIITKGAQIPIDGLTDRNVLINEAALTGESVPVEKQIHDEVFAGTINEGNAFHLTVNKTSEQTVFSNIIRMVEEAQSRPSRISKFIDRIESKYVITVLIAVPIFIFVLYALLNYPFTTAFYRGMVLLTVASPCALVASATPATLSAISNGAKNGILFKGGAAMEALSTMDILYTDKTGTLTYGNFQVIDYDVPADILKEIVYMEQQSSHPIGAAIVQTFKELDLANVNKDEAIEELPGRGIQKGQVKVGKPTIFSQYENYTSYHDKLQAGDTTILIGHENKVVGFITLADQIRATAEHAVQGFQNEHVKVTLLTGDNELVAQKVAETLNIPNYKASMLPEDKINYVLKSQDSEEVVGMIGDGINDAPALANADIGIAMGSGSSVAMESSDIIIVQNDLEKLFHSYKLSKKLNHIILQNILFSIAIIVALITLNTFGILSLPLAVLLHEGSTILVILNGLRLLRYTVQD